jgi:hypothetical protein
MWAEPVLRRDQRHLPTRALAAPSPNSSAKWLATGHSWKQFGRAAGRRPPETQENA